MHGSIKVFVMETEEGKEENIPYNKTTLRFNANKITRLLNMMGRNAYIPAIC